MIRLLHGAALLLLLAATGAANGQIAPTPLPPPVSPPPAAAPPAAISPILIHPYLPPSPSARLPPPAASPAPIDQQKMQAYRNDLLGRQRELEQQGISPAAPAYRELQQQLNGAGR